MNTDTTAYTMAQVGLKQIEDAILRLLTVNPQGLRNVEITNALGLQSDFQGGSRNYLAYSVLGILLEKGKVVRDTENRLFTNAPVMRENIVAEIQELIKSADLAFDADDFRKGSRLMWEATRTAVAAIAAQHGWPSGSMDELKEVVYRLDGIDGAGNAVKDPWHFMHFSLAITFRRHAETDEWEDPEFQWGEAAFSMGRKSVKKFVALLTQYAESGGKVQ